jgi:hypothetical protein
LIELQYPDFILACIRNFSCMKLCRRVLSELDRNVFDFFVTVLEKLTQVAWIEVKDSRFGSIAPEPCQT